VTRKKAPAADYSDWTDLKTAEFVARAAILRILTLLQLVKKLYKAGKFITAFTTSGNVAVFRAAITLITTNHF
jgi:hypothetical protein